MSEVASIWLEEPGRIGLRWTPIPIPAVGEVLVETAATLISPGTELTLLAGPEASVGRDAWKAFGQYPRPMGYSHAGTVREVGADVDPAWIGRRVASRGPHAALVVRSVTDLRTIPPEVGFDESVFCTLAGVAMNGLRRAGLTWGESVGVVGLGLVGQLAVRIAAAAGAGPVFGIDRDTSRLARLADTAVQPLAATRATADSIKRSNQGRLLDLVVEASGNAEIIESETQLLRDEGRLLLLSSPRAASSFHFHDACNRRSLQIIGVHGFSQPREPTPCNPWTSVRHGQLFLDWLATGRLTVKELISHRPSYREVERAYSLLQAGDEGALGMVFQWT